MPYPDPPAKTTSYTALEQALGNGALPGQELDTDLNALLASNAEIITFLKTTLASDGRLNNAVVRRENLSVEFSLGFEAPSVWATGTDYQVPDTVFEGGGFYICTVAHTSGTFSVDLASERWELLVDLTADGALTVVNNLSDVDDLATAQANMKIAPTDGAATITGAWDMTGAALVGPLGVLNDSAVDGLSGNSSKLMTGVPGGAGTLVQSDGAGNGAVGPSYGTSANRLLQLDGNAQIPAASVPVYESAVTSLTGASVVLGSLPAGLKTLDIMFSAVAMTASADLLVRLGTSGGVLSTGYVASGAVVEPANAEVGSKTNGLYARINGSGRALSGVMHLRREPGTQKWIASGAYTLDSAVARTGHSGGAVTLAGALTQIEFLPDAPDTFAAGTVSMRGTF